MRARACGVFLSALLLALCVPAVASACGTPAPAPVEAAPDPRFGEQWGLAQIGVEDAWRRGLRGQGVTIAVLDTGVDLGHPDLVDNVLPGADLVAHTACAQDDAGHGTPVAGVAAAASGNGVGGSGVAPEARILPLKINAPGTIGIDGDAYVEALRLATARKVDVINLSFGGLVGLVADDYRYHQALEAAARAGIVIIGAAGNDSAPVCTSPAMHPAVVCVASTDRGGLPANSSNFPVRPEGIAVRAPGGSLVVSGCDEWIFVPMDRAKPVGECAAEGFGHAVGTSFAAPHVSGLAALLASAGLTRDQILERLRDRSSNDGTYDPVYGHGIIDVAKATEGLSVAPQLDGPSPQPGGQAPTGGAPQPQPGQSQRPVTKKCLRALRASTRADRRVSKARQARRRARTPSARLRAQRRLRLVTRAAGRSRRAVRAACR